MASTGLCRDWCGLAALSLASTGCCTAVLFKDTQPNLSVSAITGRGEWGYLFLKEQCFCPSYTLGCSVMAAAWIFNHYCPCVAAVGTELHLQPRSLSFLPSCLCYLLYYNHLPMFWCMDLSDVFLCWVGDLLLNYSYMTCCRSKRRNKWVFSFCHDADVPCIVHFKRVNIMDRSFIPIMQLKINAEKILKWQK